MALFFFAANIALGVFGPYLSSKPLVEKVRAQIKGEDVLAIYGEFDASSSVGFYTGGFPFCAIGEALRRGEMAACRWKILDCGKRR